MKTEKQNTIVVQSAEASELEGQTRHIEDTTTNISCCSRRSDFMTLSLLQIKNMLEPIVSKDTRWVLRRGGVSNHSDLSDTYDIIKYFHLQLIFIM